MREIACDESGYEGEKLIGSTTRLFAHASVRIADPAGVLTELRARIRSPATQYKANHLLRAKHHETLAWFLGPSGPMRGNGHVFLLDKPAFVRSVAASVLGLDLPDTGLAAVNDALRLRRGDPLPSMAASPPFPSAAGPPSFPGAAAFREWLCEDPIGRSVLDPLVPALVAAVRQWGPVAVAHDRQTQLPPRRIDLLRERCGGDLLGFRFLDAESHPQIQLADMLAGTVRHIAETGEPRWSELIAPYLLK
ncbi:hypothetical protein [Actinoplanes awajinensis]|uniref:DUF3800 domain-containing protein n=1 Tax=Actinoplanes awajinensis subsp. mycoplanecinus TaxID=135947 RepID=A0A101JT64_9ACTN|nr:hypothetical protein [Actinoplanes awajinensis]KUL32668.1 hypothetical protein ADL15_19325 [Actinoplanes awajinensis subsp. mycoplanecinus]